MSLWGKDLKTVTTYDNEIWDKLDDLALTGIGAATFTIAGVVAFITSSTLNVARPKGIWIHVRKEYPVFVDDALPAHVFPKPVFEIG